MTDDKPVDDRARFPMPRDLRDRLKELAAKGRVTMVKLIEVWVERAEAKDEGGVDGYCPKCGECQVVCYCGECETDLYPLVVTMAKERKQDA